MGGSVGKLPRPEGHDKAGLALDSPRARLYRIKYFSLQTISVVTLFDLLFILLFLTAVVTLGAALIAALRGRTGVAGRLLRRLVVAAGGYLGVVVVVSLVTPQRVIAIGDDQCSDDWCIAVSQVRRTPVANGVTVEVTFRVSSRARRVEQRERGVIVYLRDAHGRRVDPVARATDLPFDVRLAPQAQVTTSREFLVPADATELGIVVARSGLPFPGCCIIGDESSLFHKRTIVRLDSSQSNP